MYNRFGWSVSGKSLTRINRKKSPLVQFSRFYDNSTVTSSCPRGRRLSELSYTVLTERDQGIIFRLDHVVQHYAIFFHVCEKIVLHKVFVKFVQVLGHVLRVRVIRRLHEFLLPGVQKLCKSNSPPPRYDIVVVQLTARALNSNVKRLTDDLFSGRHEHRLDVMENLHHSRLDRFQHVAPVRGDRVRRLFQHALHVFYERNVNVSY